MLNTFMLGLVIKKEKQPVLLVMVLAIHQHIEVIQGNVQLAMDLDT